MYQFDEDKENRFRTYSIRPSSVQRSQWAPNVPNDHDDSILVYLSDVDSPRAVYSSIDTTSCRLAWGGLRGPCCAEIVADVWDCNKARLWLETCASCHGDVCKQNTMMVAGMNLIDCENMVIVKAEEGLCWVALSYVWGADYQPSGSDLLGYREGSKLSATVPTTIRDAVHVTLQLGYRYLWIDEYCIDQSDETHRKEQIEKMDQIYQGASLTIVAAAGTDKAYGLPGVLTTRRKGRKVARIDDVILFSNGPDPCKVAERSKWFTRAWTFQESLLSRRLLVFTDYQMIFQCSTTSTKE
ncbi:heterokaryon incompatibility protein-domain-containing protein, partial [Phaeosphaeria sp. MPI-PUGE-AT-0046c]